VTEVVPTDLFDYLEWQGRRPSTAGRKVVRLAEARGVAPSTMNRRIAAVRGLFAYAVLVEVVERNRVPVAGTTSPRGRRGSAGACVIAASDGGPAGAPATQPA
jgi:integrase/recombinase XerC